MSRPYATLAQFSAVHCLSTIGVTDAQINSHYLFDASLRLEERLGDLFTVPFSTDNLTARQLTIEVAYLDVIETRGRKQDDVEKLRKMVNDRIDGIRKAGNMITSNGVLRTSGAGHDVWSTTQDYKPTFDIRDREYQRRDPDYLTDLDDRDTP